MIDLFTHSNPALLWRAQPHTLPCPTLPCPGPSAGGRVEREEGGGRRKRRRRGRIGREGEGGGSPVQWRQRRGRDALLLLQQGAGQEGLAAQQQAEGSSQYPAAAMC